MSKTTSQNQGAFSFFDEVEKVDPLPKPRKHILKPPAQIEADAVTEKSVEDTPAAATGNGQKEELHTREERTEMGEAFQEIVVKHPMAKTQPLEDQPFAVKEVVLETEQPDFSDAISIAGPAAEDRTFERKSTRGRKSVKEHTIAAGMIEMPDDEVLFSKQYYSMGEVTAMFRENHSLIRYWESEFDILKPKKNGKGDRFFRPIDVKNLYLIYDLLRRRKFTIEGAREYLKNNKKAEEKFAAVQSLEKIKTFFLELKASL
ncbi:MerR family transcriptional regulator [Niabella aquatica]